MDNVDEVIDLKPLKESRKNVYGCAICGFQTLYRSNLRKHNMVHLAPEERHLLKKSQKKVKCSICDYRTRDMTNLRQHEAVHLAPEERELFGCTHCEKKYMSEKGLKAHLKDHSDSRLPMPELKESQKKMRCSNCDYHTSRISDLRRHEAVHLALEERQLFGCTHCEKKYTTKHGLKEHLRDIHLEDIHSNFKSQKVEKKDYRCAICGYQTLERSNFYRHKKIHLAPKERQLFCCTHCDKKYASKCSLQYHFGYVHTDPRSEDAQKNIHKCSNCDYQTIIMSNFKQHQKIHLAPEERQMFACTHCDKKYRNKDNLKHHIEKKHNVSRPNGGQKQVYSCTICGYETPRQFNFNTHKQIHLAPEERQLFACRQCDKKYTSNQTLQRHIKCSHVDSRNADCISPNNKVILDSLKIEVNNDVPLLENHKNAACLSVTSVPSKIKSEIFFKTEIEDDSPVLNNNIHADLENTDCLSVTNEVKSEDFLKIKIDDVPFFNKDMPDYFKNSEDFSVSKKIKLEDFIKMEPDDAPLLDEDRAF
ncbi:gastrula zinc finger protein XlCGF26.1-like isoform X2 [Sitophilus oryzae]|uniref:Gastrula zinc finger protein XlCGF26.1-like isoform X2 n=1 Tax=Sitophilus oryzae TaxID=7048 RepID=A0A6J2XQ29_SITOR|nr:gastrula zinc finger protein XlCGF26.1-like isoform X2 [Sitophilus oryzae]